nr:protein kinase [Pseudenhygromyxa sp. WMMC2535]
MAQSAEVSELGGPSAGNKLGRYVVLEQLGQGGMGVVYSAWDPQLDRKLALKIIHPRRGREPSTAHARLLREAQALARLVHPNVVTVHDVGVVDGRVFVAMQFVEGQSLRAWLGAGERPQDQVLAHFMAAGRGLAAAHEAGLIHRDFKPDNVMVGTDGRIRVLDFGLARDSDEREEEVEHSGPRIVDLESGTLDSLTVTGALVGTPAYMSPEQFEGAALDARSDQFSFCVALWEALAGERPFPGVRQLELMESVTGGKRRDFPRSEVPDRVIRALERGLERDPDARWPDMTSLLAALEVPVAKSRRLRLAILAASVLSLGLGLLAGPLFGTPREEDGAAALCEAEGRMDQVWNEQRAQTIEAAFMDTGLNWAQRGAERVDDHLDAWAERWRAAARRSCALRSGEVIGASALLIASRERCLDSQLDEFDAFLELLEQGANPHQIEVSLVTGSALGQVEYCEDSRKLLANALPKDPELAAKASKLREQISHGQQLVSAGRYVEALAELEALEPQLDGLELHALRSAYWSSRTIALIGLGRYEEAMSTAAEFFAAALRGKVDIDTAQAALYLARASLRSGRVEESERWLVVAEVLSEDSVDIWSRLEIFKARGFLARVRHDFETARAAFESALAISREAYGPDAFFTATELANLGDVTEDLSVLAPARSEEAVALLRESLRLMALNSSEEHPTTVAIELHYVDALTRAGEVEAALAELDATAPRLARLYPAAHHIHLRAQLQRARSLELLGRCDEAQAGYDAAVAWAFEHAKSVGSERLAMAVAAKLRGCIGEADAALARADEGVAQLGLDELAPSNAAQAQVLLARATLRLRAGQPALAAADLERARIGGLEAEGFGWRAVLQAQVLGELLALRGGGVIAVAEAEASEEESLARLREARGALDVLAEPQLVLVVDEVLRLGE